MTEPLFIRKISRAKKRQIIELACEGFPHFYICKRFDLSMNQVTMIFNGLAMQYPEPKDQPKTKGFEWMNKPILKEETMRTVNNLNLLAAANYSQNVKVGWWPNHDKGFQPDELETKVALIHSELSEALEGVRKDLMDTHLPTHKMALVEMADTAIRLMDLHSACGLEFKEYRKPFTYEGLTQSTAICRMHSTVSRYLSALDDHFEGWEPEESCDLIASELIARIEGFCIYYDYGDLWKVIKEKKEYNLHRADHKKEAREKAGGKAF